MIFGEAQRACLRARHERLLKSQELPLEKDVVTLKRYTEKRMKVDHILNFPYKIKFTPG